jgi:hypothetical protein
MFITLGDDGGFTQVLSHHYSKGLFSGIYQFVNKSLELKTIFNSKVLTNLPEDSENLYSMSIIKEDYEDFDLDLIDQVVEAMNEED